MPEMRIETGCVCHDHGLRLHIITMSFPASSPIGWMTDCAACFRFKVNFGQLDPWFPPPQGFVYISQLPVLERVRGMRCPERKADCEVRL